MNKQEIVQQCEIISIIGCNECSLPAACLGGGGGGGELRQVYSHCVFAHARYLLLGWVEVIRSGLKKHSDFLTLGNVDWQLNEGLQAQKITGNFGNPINWPVKILHTVKSSLSCTMNAVPLLLQGNVNRTHFFFLE